MVMEIIREGLIITPTGSLEPSQGSYDVPVKLINDETYPYYTINMYVGYYVNGVIKKRKCETDSEGHYLIPGIAFLRSGIISISFLLETADKSQGLMTNALSYEIKHAPNVVVETPPDPTWQELVKEWIQELAGAVNVDNTLTKSGMAADAKATGDAISKLSDEIANVGKPSDEQVSSAVNNYIEENGISAGGLTKAQVTLFEQLFNNLAYTDNVIGKATADSLIASLRASASSGGNTGGDSGEDGGEDTPTEPTVKTYSITNSLANATTDNDITSVEENASYTATITPNEQYKLGNATVTMGGVDVTSTVYINGVINIPQVTGDVIIMVETISTKAVAVYTLPQATTFNGTSGIDTNITLDLKNTSWSIVGDVTNATSGTMFATHGSIEAHQLCIRNHGNGWGVYHMNGTTSVKVDDDNWDGTFKFVITHNEGENTIDVYHINGELVKQTPTLNYLTNASAYPTTLKVASDRTGTGSYFKGTVNDFKIYNGMLIDSEINEYLGV